MGDRLLVAMTGEVKPGELGYFEYHHCYDSGADYRHRSFFFVAERGRTCRESAAKAGVCLRTFVDNCDGRHVGSEDEPVRGSLQTIVWWDSATPYGRVVGAERDRRPLETTLPVRPYDEREGGPKTFLRQSRSSDAEHGPKDSPPEPRDLAPEQKQRIRELRERIKRIDEEDNYRDEGRLFRLEREIYDLEHPAPAPDELDWPEYIGVKGGAR